MMQQHRGYWIDGSAVPGPPYTSYWESVGMVLKPGRQGSVIEVCRLHDSGVTFEMRELAEWYGLELSRIAVDECFECAGNG
ncbi:MAG: hypothetical protein DMG15_21385 [Acidobacteria bacterium]|jgi:hypothetical protein|nr:MAG: hypothetical protein DMG15_21385 [Acidobacteriota bacterium]